MIYIGYLLKILETEKLSELVKMIDATPLEMNLAIYAAEDSGDIELDATKDYVKLLNNDPEPGYTPELAAMLMATIQHYASKGTNITRGRMNALIKDPITNIGFPMHEYVATMQYLADSGQIVEDIIEVPKTKKRPYHKFVFIGLPENEAQNAEWNAKVVNKWIADFEKTK